MNKKALSSFRKVTPEFESFIKAFVHLYPGSFYFMNKKKYLVSTLPNEIEKIYKILFYSDADYLFKAYGSREIYFCKKENFKQILFNIRRNKLKPFKSMLKIKDGDSRYLNPKYRMANLQMTKINFAKRFNICVYGVEENKGISYKPFVKLKNSPKKKHLKILMPEFV